MDIKKSVIIITGASSGIGQATALKLAKNGAKVVLAARSKDKLEKLRKEIEADGGEAFVAECDVTKSKDFEKVVADSIKKFGSVHCLINNAGLMPLSYMKNLKTDEWEKMVDVNIKGVLNGVAAVLPVFMENKRGFIINVSSTAAYRYFPGGAVYCATKAAVKMLSEGLRQELAPTFGIHVTSIEPGAVDTNLLSTITDKEIKEDLKSLKEMTRLEAEDIAESIFYALSQPQRVNINDVYIMPTEQQ